jgi:hypothetical protein
MTPILDYIRHDVQVQEKQRAHNTIFPGQCRKERKVKSDESGTPECGRERAPPILVSIDLSLVAWAVLDTLHFKLLLDVVGDTALHGDRIHPTHVFI